MSLVLVPVLTLSMSAKNLVVKASQDSSDDPYLYFCVSMLVEALKLMVSALQYAGHLQTSR